MGVTINSSILTTDVLKKATTPFIFCSITNRVARLIEDGQYIPLNMNNELAEALIQFPQTDRSHRANDEIMSIVSQCNAPTLFEDYEILFDPRYEVDAIKVFTELARRQKVAVKWCGKLNGNSLEYATPDDKDYHSFRVQDYDITCVI